MQANEQNYQLLLMALAAMVRRQGGAVELTKSEIEELEVCDLSWGYEPQKEVLVLKVSVEGTPDGEDVSSEGQG